ncbi:zinc-binding alcohol dehydrogenase [Paracoccus sp. MBLB3053]|uniref:Zinc-binding alcohol dehydrogenase n=1 Tax=Paracoccus aurantius TaxID=3073814 RepID=A0ABU2HN50_9RHOB|nr:zinc-binding alcohol dehydrogenase [Paracoccus sp. MBLB3053]MDS9466202.1 zinc-binding alcohol dehydrogenase [Paracoccus sp. MBLB3053]
MTASALWCIAPGEVEIRPGTEGAGTLVETAFTGISRGTERLVSEGRVPRDEWHRMRAPFQEGDFPFPVKYGYSAVGVAQDGRHAGNPVFALFPHQDRFRLPETNLIPLPPRVPPERAVLAANMETALNIIWDSQAGAGDRIAIIGAGLVGLLTGYLAARLPGAEVTLVDPLRQRARPARNLGCEFAISPPAGQDVVIHCSATQAGLASAIDAAGPGAVVVEASWHGRGLTALPLGGAFHSRRLRLISSQVGTLPSERLPRWTTRRRLEKALELLADPVLDLLISGETALMDLPSEYPRILADPDTLCHRIRF